MRHFEQNPPLQRLGVDATRFEEYSTPAYQLLGEELVSVRQVPPNRRSVTGLYASRKAGKMVAFESQLERDLAATLEFSDTVRAYDTQPVAIRYRSLTGKLVIGYPDFLITFGYGPPMLCDVKFRKEIFERWRELKPRFKAARKHALENGWIYRITTEVEIRTPFLANARFLLPYARCTPDPDHEAVLTPMLRSMGTATPQSLLAACCADPWNQAQLIPTLWSLIGRRSFSTDLDERLTMTSTIWWPAAR